MSSMSPFALSVQWPVDWAVTFAGLRVLLVLAAALVATFLLRVGLNRVKRALSHMPHMDAQQRGEYVKRISTVTMLLRGMLLAAVWVLALVMALREMGLDITPIIAGVGVLGLALGFGAQNLVRDLISGLFTIVEDQIRVGDIALINGTGGVVERITYRIVVLRDLEQRVHVFSHGKIDTLSNLTKDHSAMVVDIGAAYKERPDEVIQALQAVGAEMLADPDWQPKLIAPVEVLGLESFGDSAVNYRVRYMTRPGEQWSVKREYQRRVKLAFDARGIEFPFPHRTLYIAADSAPMAVRMAEPGGGRLLE